MVERVREPSVKIRAEGRETKILGLVLHEQRRSVERLVGEPIYERALARLDEGRRVELLEASMFGWCRTSTAAEFLTAAANEAGLSTAELTRTVVREGFGTIMRTVWRLFVAFSSEEAIVRRAATVYTKAVDRGRAVASVERPGHLVLEISEWPDISAIDIVAIASGIEAALEVAGRSASVQHRRVRGTDVRFDVLTRLIDEA